MLDTNCTQGCFLILNINKEHFNTGVRKTLAQQYTFLITRVQERGVMLFHMQAIRQVALPNRRGCCVAQQVRGASTLLSSPECPRQVPRSPASIWPARTPLESGAPSAPSHWSVVGHVDRGHRRREYIYPPVGVSGSQGCTRLWNTSCCFVLSHPTSLERDSLLFQPPFPEGARV
ncbi:hypothetical protein TNCV_2629361 [Trichonephila clavipes]|uniref:Uncharacterized protein n=1 Tax=Trichonephila clavipes TaxID=2585209 RepID=A0A8X6SJF4_TRICX|nr:hypothetical protein TNCV_2629361 [Trichonephila clavipes]